MMQLILIIFITALLMILASIDSFRQRVPFTPIQCQHRRGQVN
jgi:hypothetical protein